MLNSFYNLLPFHLSGFGCKRGRRGLFTFRIRGRRIAVIKCCKISPTSNSSCFTSNEGYTRLLLFSSNLYPYVALCDKLWRVTIGLLLFSKLYSYVALLGKYMIPPDGLSRLFRVVLRLFVHVASYWDMITFDIKPSSDEQSLREKTDCFHQNKNWDHTSRKKRSSVPGVPQKTLEILKFCLPLFIGGPLYKPAPGEKRYLPPYGCTVL